MEPVVDVAGGLDVDVLVNAHGAVAHESGHVFEADAGLGQGGEHVGWRVERPGPRAVLVELGEATVDHDGEIDVLTPPQPRIRDEEDLKVPPPHLRPFSARPGKGLGAAAAP